MHRTTHKKYGKKREWINEYLGTDSRNFDLSCRNHGGCDRCRNGRLHTNLVREFDSFDELEEFLKGDITIVSN